MPRQNTGPHLWADRRTGIWQVRWFEARRAHTRSASTRDRAQAEEYLAHFLLEQRRPDLGRDAVIGSVLDMWLNHKTRISQRSTGWKVKALKSHLGWLRVEDYRAAHTRSYIAARRRDGRADSTIRDELQKLSSALRWAVSEQMIASAPLIVPNLKCKPKTRWLTPDEADRLLAACIAPHMRMFVMLALHTGARHAAILELTWDRVDLDTRLVDYGVKDGGKPRAVVPINDDLLVELQAAKALATTKHVVEWAGAPVRKINGGFQRTVERAKLAHCSPHDLRRTAGHWLLQRGTRIAEVAGVLGHTSSATTERVYARLYPEHLRSAVKRLQRA